MVSPAQLAKEQGNVAFKSQKYDLARGHYADAMLMDPSEYLYPLNKSMADLKLKMWPEAEADATTALELAPENTKAYYRRSVARREQANLLGARQDIEAFTKFGGSQECAEEETAKIAAAELSPTSASSKVKPKVPQHSPTAGGTARHTDATAASHDGFIVTESAGKGLGAIASQTFHRGDLILAERPLYIVNNPDDGGIRNQNNVVAAAGRLSPAEREQFLSLKNAYAGSSVQSPILGIHSTNAVSAGDDGESLSAMCIVASRFNHSCSPNARYSWHSKNGRLRIYALREIAVGEEIFVSYISGRHVYGTSRKDRQNRLNGYGFTCACAVCVLPSPEGDTSDRRRMEIAKIWESVPMYGPQSTAARLRAIVRALRLLEEEGYAADADDFTNDAAAICAGHSDWESAQYWATKTYETRVAEFGKDSKRAAEVHSMHLDPKKSPYAGMVKKQKFLVRL